MSSMQRIYLLMVVVIAGMVTVSGVHGGGIQVQLKQGVFRGETQEAGEGRIFHSFRGIPYAKPPVGPLRFKDPEELEGWEGTKESSTPPQCPQIIIESMLKGEMKVGGKEDCLYLNLYTPKVCGGELLPVMVFLHGGAFTFGNADIVGGTPLPLLTKDIVLVSVQYRLGTLGFMSTGDSVMPGNYGLKDQTLALKWIRDNIRSFSGDPDSVTIFGESAGGASVHLQMLTPKSEGLFHRAIMQSGSGLAPWAVRGDHHITAAVVGHNLNCTAIEGPDGRLDSVALLACLHKASIKELVMAATLRESWNNFPFYTVPRVDGDYLPAHPATLVREGRHHRVDVMSGVCQHEGVSAAISAIALPAGTELIQYFATKGPISVGTDESEYSLYTARRIYYHYLGSGNISLTEDKVDQIVEMYGDATFSVGQDLSAQFLSRDAYGRKVFMYRLEYVGQNSFSSYLNTTMKIRWVSHGDDLLYLFNGVFGLRPLETPEEKFLSKIMVDLWTNFAVTGNPTPDASLGFRWLPATPSSLHYLSLKPAPVMLPDSRAEIRAFHTDLPTKINMLLYPEKFPAKSIINKNAEESEYCHL